MPVRGPRMDPRVGRHLPRLPAELRPAAEPEQQPSGLKWRDIGSKKPHHGVELVNAELSKALQQKTKFTQAEWNTFGVKDLSTDTFIEVGGTRGTRVYFQPAGGWSQSDRLRRLLKFISDVHILTARTQFVEALVAKLKICVVHFQVVLLLAEVLLAEVLAPLLLQSTAADAVHLTVSADRAD